MQNKLTTFLKKLRYKFFPVEMVSWWMHKEAVQAKVTQDKDGSYIMWMDGEKYPFPGYPRGHLLYGTLSKLKHEIKNQIFNENWWRLERNEPVDVHTACQNIYELAELSKYDMLPYPKMCPAVKEMYKGVSHPVWRDVVSFIAQEDDAYRWRMMFFFMFVDPKTPYKRLRTWWNGWTREEALKKYSAEAFDLLENCEIIGDMKERMRLIKRIMLELMEKPYFMTPYMNMIYSMNMKKVYPRKADLYFYRAKYVYVDKYKMFLGKVFDWKEY